jgi:hypothetical protein
MLHVIERQLLFRHSGKTRERREDHRSQEKNLQVSKYGIKEERIIEIYHKKKIANFQRIKTNSRNAIYQCVQTHSFMRN